jgi:hypothetical protein
MNWLKQNFQRVLIFLGGESSPPDGLVKHVVIRHVPVKGKIVRTHECYYTPATEKPRDAVSWERPEEY